MVSLFMNIYQVWDINIILSYIIEDFKNKFLHSNYIITLVYNKGYISEYYIRKPELIQHFINESFKDYHKNKEKLCTEFLKYLYC